MGEGKDMTDQIYDSLMSELAEIGYENISTKANNLIVDLIDVGKEVKELIPEAINIIKNNP